jgi:hypothetical protein
MCVSFSDRNDTDLGRSHGFIEKYQKVRHKIELQIKRR